MGSQSLNSGQNRRNEYNGRNSGQTTGAQDIHVHIHNRGLDFWDFLLLQCCINSLFGGHGHTTVMHNYGNIASQSREDKKKRLGR
ncbi:hypothetical protein [Wolbachia endosymbiont of Mansonella perstans]|uniref:hypothetical protein n=1 Tax=Wolbachia endosymbiont of Mansonella perstans TaxID=229526 RepID=UPI001CE1C312|nr:hypothetical protein [Wolbachia endosymbiont of Mansonella perstans]MCA4773919.1 hypothetical protein [Wolbachia endosymbiont of Mansonella perstans]